jgi:hypothetical protein
MFLLTGGNYAIRRFLAPSPDKMGISVIQCIIGADPVNTYRTREKSNKMSTQNIEINSQHAPQMTSVSRISYFTPLFTSFSTEI